MAGKAFFKNLIFTGLTVFATLKLKSQISVLPIDNRFNSALEISSMVIYNGQIILVAEKCEQIFYLDHEFKITKITQINKSEFLPKELEIEGAALYKNGLLLTDEKNAKIYVYDLAGSSLKEVNTDYDLSDNVGSHGLEGIAVDSVNNVCYLLQESNGNSQSVIHIFNITVESDNLSLTLVRNVYVNQPDDSWRYCDLFFNEKDQYLYCLKSKYGCYQIDTIPTSFSVSTEDVIIPLTKTKHFLDISEDVNAREKDGYNSNMEGMTINSEIIYVVSDNAEMGHDKCNLPGQGKTLLLTIELTKRHRMD